MIMAMLNDKGYDSHAGDDHCCDRRLMGDIHLTNPVLRNQPE